jgi:hypothetical protein
VSDTVSQPPKRFRKACGGVLFLLGAVVLGVSAYGLYVRSAIRSTEPLPFKAFNYRPLERSLLTAKFEFLELPSKLLGSTAPIQVRLDERELNALLFGEARHQDAGPKARVTVVEDRLLYEFSKPTEDGEAFVNVTATLRVTFAPPKAPDGDSVTISIVEGQVGEYTLGPVLRPWVQSALSKAVNERYARDSRLSRIEALTIVAGRAQIVYRPN